jgi:hypothetical protein
MKWIMALTAALTSSQRAQKIIYQKQLLAPNYYWYSFPFETNKLLVRMPKTTTKNRPPAGPSETRMSDRRKFGFWAN